MLLTAISALSQNYIMQIHHNGDIVYERNTSQVDSITIKTLPMICNVDNPLTDLPWLREFCENIKDTQTLSNVPFFGEIQNVSTFYINIFRIIGKNEYVFEINSSFLFEESTSEQGEIGNLTDWRKCTGEVIFYIPYPATPPDPEMVENFMKDKEFVAELFHFKQ